MKGGGKRSEDDDKIFQFLFEFIVLLKDFNNRLDNSTGVWSTNLELGFNQASFWALSPLDLGGPSTSW